MNVRAVVSGDQNYQLTTAILVYEQKSGQNGFLTVHPIIKNVIHPGNAVTPDVISKMLQSMRLNHSSLWIDAATLIDREDIWCWWSKPQKRQVWFRAADPIGTCSAEVSIPSLLWVVTPSAWYVCALKGDARPDQGAQLFVAPLFNVWAGGKICEGNIQRPSFSDRIPEAWESVFWNSEFTHPNIHLSKSFTLAEGGAVGLWQGLLAGNTFEESSLVPMEMTVAAWIEKIMGDA